MILYKDVTMTIRISMQPAFFSFFSHGFQVISGHGFSQHVLRLAELWAPSSSYTGTAVKAAAGRFAAGMHFEMVGEDRHETWNNWT